MPADDYILGDNFYFGKNNTRQNYKKAVFHYKLAIKKEHATAMYMLGICHYNGHGVEKSITTAIWYWNMAYAFGENNHACYELGCSYYLGEGILKKDPKAAFKLWKISADNGNAGSMVEVGNSYYYGDGVEQSNDNAFEYWCRAQKKRN